MKKLVSIPDVFQTALQESGLEKTHLRRPLFSSKSRMKYEKVHSIYNKLLVIEDIDPTLVYIQYMKFARRAEGIKSGRSIFKKAREDPRTRHHVFVSAALMEYYCSKVRTPPARAVTHRHAPPLIQASTHTGQVGSL